MALDCQLPSSIGHEGTGTNLPKIDFQNLENYIKKYGKQSSENMNSIPLYGSRLSAGESGSAVIASAAKL